MMSKMLIIFKDNFIISDNAEFWIKQRKKACWELEVRLKTFGLENKVNPSHIIYDDPHFPFYLLVILCQFPSEV